MFNKWEHVRNYFMRVSMYGYVTRKQYLAYMASMHGIRAVTCDNNRCILMTAGYLKRIKIGVYQKINCIPYYLTYTQVRDKAYPKIKK